MIYHDARGGSHVATVTRVEGGGPSGHKLLDVTFAGGAATDVPHMVDWEGADFWAFPEQDVREPAPTPVVIPDTHAEPDDFTAFDAP